eukprot:TRINITY_DN4012_c0_g1_i2.p1 TRINITY_DN4012_c0_g1~~TRINITY_DN4012_c0_g1_i2.p1  ORF type:complete len:426 (-),score=8.71 TRINITY_DN4012_c0_g1_i2:35-1312(-)
MLWKNIGIVFVFVGLFVAIKLQLPADKPLEPVRLNPLTPVTESHSITVSSYPVDDYATQSNSVPSFPDDNSTHVYILSEYTTSGQPDFAIYSWITQDITITFALDRVRLRETLAAVAENHSSGTVIMTFSNLKYHDVLVNWMIGLETSGVDNYFVFSLDEKTKQWMKDHNVPTMVIPMVHFPALWFVRMIVFRNIATVGVPFIHTDTDAVWVQNPLPFLATLVKHQNSSIFFSQGTVAPSKLSAKWGFVVCGGFFFVRPTPWVTTELLGSVLLDLLSNSRVPKYETDQDSLNWSLHNEHIQWHIVPNTTYKKRQFRAQFTCSQQPIVGTFPKSTETITLLPHHLFQRKAMYRRFGEPYVLHLYAKTNPASKMLVFRKYGLWRIRDDWMEVAWASNRTQWVLGTVNKTTKVNYYKTIPDRNFEDVV